MRALLASLFALTFVACSHAANPSFSSFFTNHFTTNSFIIKAKLNTNQFDAGATNLTITITNVSGITGGSKWTNWPDGILRVIDGNAVSGVAITNLSTHEGAVFNGAIGFGNSFSTNLVAGANDVSQAYSSYQWITGASANPADSTLRLSADVGAGGYQFLLLENYSQNSGFTLFDNDTLYNDPSQTVRLRGNWAPTEQGDSILLIHDGRGWRELARESVVSGGDGNVFGNGTPLYLPIWLTATSQGDSPVHIPSAGSTNIIVDGSIMFAGTTNVLSRTDTDLTYQNVNSFGTFIRVSSDGVNYAYYGANGNVAKITGPLALYMQATPAAASVVLTTAALGSASPGVLDLGSTAIPWHDVYLTNKIIFTPGTTNTFFRSNSDFVLENDDGSGFKLLLRGTAGDAEYRVNSNGAAVISSSVAGQPVILQAGGQSDGLFVTVDSLQPGLETMSIGNGTSNGAWVDQYFKGTLRQQGLNDGLGNTTLLEITHEGNAGDIVYNSNATGTGSVRPHVFEVNEVPTVKIDTTSAAGQTRFWLYDEDNGTMERVTVGAADSGGVGFKLLRIPN